MINFLFSFKGRISRADYWVICLGTTVGVLVPILLLSRAASSLGQTLSTFGILAIWLIGMVVGISASVRRFHDRDKSGWWYLICVVPVIGSVWLLIENGFLKGTVGPNRYGPNPLAEASEPVAEH